MFQLTSKTFSPNLAQVNLVLTATSFSPIWFGLLIKPSSFPQIYSSSRYRISSSPVKMLHSSCLSLGCGVPLAISIFQRYLSSKYTSHRLSGKLKARQKSRWAASDVKAGILSMASSTSTTSQSSEHSAQCQISRASKWWEKITWNESKITKNFILMFNIVQRGFAMQVLFSAQ